MHVRLLQHGGCLLFVGGLLVGGLLAGWTALDDSPSSIRVAGQTTGVQPRSSADTLRYTVSAGEPLVLALPDTLDGRPIRSYTTLRAPALSRLVDRAFFWQTRPRDAGRHRLRFAALPPDTLTVLVTVEGRGS